MMNFCALTIEMGMAVLALLLLVADLCMNENQSRRSIGYMAAAGVAGLLAFSFTQYGTNSTFWHGMFLQDDFALFFKSAFCHGFRHDINIC